LVGQDGTLLGQEKLLGQQLVGKELHRLPRFNLLPS
jgi:hypothetical protein